MSSAKCRPFCLDLNVLMRHWTNYADIIIQMTVIKSSGRTGFGIKLSGRMPWKQDMQSEAM